MVVQDVLRTATATAPVNWSTCNHGTCANGWATSAIGGREQQSVNETGPTETYNDRRQRRQGGCQTAYNWDSGGYDHLCNDDTAYEVWQG